jgi:predicted phosphodiesterase
MLEGLIDQSMSEDLVKKKYGSALGIAMRTLSSDILKLIKNQKRSMRLRIDGVNVLLAHGSPWSTDQYIYPDASKELIDQCDSDELDYVFLGHTHYPFICQAQHALIVNPGSVGQSRVCGGVADWGILNTNNNVYTPKHTPYNVKQLSELVEKTDPDVPYLRDILYRNRFE